MNRKNVGIGLLLILIVLGAGFLFFSPKEINGTTEPIVTAGRWYKGEVIHIVGYPDYDIIYVLGRISMLIDIHVTTIRQMPSTFIITFDDGNYIKLGDTLYKIVGSSRTEGWVEYEIS